ncbi:unnamed protein product [Camellia sinensis]
MSWQTYVDDHLMCDIEGNHLTAASILGHDGSIWAQSSSFPKFKPEEITGIMKDFDEPGFLAPTGLYLGGTKYMVIQGEAGAVIRGKKCVTLLVVSLLYLLFIMKSTRSTEESLAAFFICASMTLDSSSEVAGGAGGVTIKKTGQALIFGIYDEPVTPGQCNMVVERMGDYLIDQGL